MMEVDGGDGIIMMEVERGRGESEDDGMITHISLCGCGDLLVASCKLGSGGGGGGRLLEEPRAREGASVSASLGMTGVTTAVCFASATRP